MSIKKAHAALSYSVFTSLTRNHLDRLVAKLAAPFQAAREGRLYQLRGGRQRRRYPGAGHPETLTLRDRVLVTLAWLRLAMPHRALAVWYGVDRSTISAAVRQITPLLADRGFATPTGVGVHALADALPTPPPKGWWYGWTVPRSRFVVPRPAAPAAARSCPARRNEHDQDDHRV